MSFPGSEAARIAIQALINQLTLAVQLLQAAKQSTGDLSGRDQLVAYAREACRHSIESLTRVPQLSQEEMKLVDSLTEEFRFCLRDLDE